MSVVCVFLSSTKSLRAVTVGPLFLAKRLGSAQLLSFKTFAFSRLIDLLPRKKGKVKISAEEFACMAVVWEVEGINL